MSDSTTDSIKPAPDGIGEFDLIKRVFEARALEMAKLVPENAPVLGIGDDCALIKPNDHELIAITSDMLIAGRHFFPDTDPYLLGKKSLAVNLSDLAAMGASPTGFTLSIALPKIQNEWVESFARGLFEEAQQFNCHLLGGDTVAGPLTINITAFGSVPPNKSLQRNGAQRNDDIWVSGTLGDARLALAHARNDWPINLSADELAQINQRLHTPIPRVELGIALRGIASAALDLSDGLLGDLNHILAASKVNATVWLESLPLSNVLKQQSVPIRWQCAATGGDDYELCFTANPKHRSLLEQISNDLGISLTRIGQIVEHKANVPRNINLLDQDGKALGVELTNSLLQSFDHFKA